MSKNKVFSLHRMTAAAVMAAACFAATYFLKIDIVTPIGPTMIKLGNAFCLISGLLLGPVSGGLAAGFGCMFFDLMNPLYISSAPFSFAFYFLMAFICGLISHSKGHDGKKLFLNILGSISGALAYVFLYTVKSIIALILEGSDVKAAIVSVAASKLPFSLINAAVGVAVAVSLYAALRPALEKAGLLKEMSK